MLKVKNIVSVIMVMILSQGCSGQAKPCTSDPSIIGKWEWLYSSVELAPAVGGDSKAVEFNKECSYTTFINGTVEATGTYSVNGSGNEQMCVVNDGFIDVPLKIIFYRDTLCLQEQGDDGTSSYYLKK